MKAAAAALWALLQEGAPVIVQGLTGRQGSFHAERMMAYGTNIAAGVTPGKGGTTHLGVPVFDTVREARAATGAAISVLFVPAPHAPKAILEAAEASVRLIVVITEGIPVLDMVRVRKALGAMQEPPILIGPNCPGLIAPGARMKLGIMPAAIHRPGRIAVVSRSGTLTYEAVAQLSAVGLGQRLCIGIGGDPVHGLGFAEALEIFADDPEVEGVVLIGEIGGADELVAAERIRAMDKPVVAFVAGRTAPPGRRMGHAGAVIMGGADTAEAKMQALAEAGAHVVDNPARIGEAMRRALG